MFLQIEPNVCAYLLKALHYESVKLLLENSLQVVAYEVLCLVKIYHYLYEFY
jgi:hypothetical protein